MPTLKEGIAIVGAPTPVDPVTAAAAAAAELLRSRGTAHGHALSVAAGNQGTMPVSIDDRMKGTLLGHSLHLPDAPPILEEAEKRPAEIREIARIPAKTLFVPAPEQTASEFSHGDSRFFETSPATTVFVPENPRGKMMARGAIFVAVLSIFVVAAIAWWRAGNALPTETPALPPIKPSPLDNNSSTGGAPTAAAPSEAPLPAAPPRRRPPVGAGRCRTGRRPAASPSGRRRGRRVQAQSRPPREEPAPAARPRPRQRHEVPPPSAPPAKPQPVAPRAARPAAPHAAPVSQPPHDTKPVVPGKHGKSDHEPRSRRHVAPERLRESLHMQIAPDQIDPDAAKVVQRLRDNEHLAYLVGGCVRDLLLGLKPKDFDVVTSATPNEIKRVFKNCRIIGRRFKLAHIFFGPKIIETATFRANPRELEDDDAGGDESGDLLIRRDNVFGTPEEDARRRDFTINGLFYDTKTKQVIDHVNGMADLEARVVRTIGDPDIRFREDPIRILRAVKFAALLGSRSSPRPIGA